MNNRYNVRLMYIIVFLQGFVFYGPVATLYRQARGLSMFQIFQLESVFFILAIFLEVPWGWVADRIGYKKVLIISNAVFFLSKLAFYAAHSYLMFLAEAILISIAISGISGCDTALLYVSAGPEESQKVFGRYNAYSTAGFLTASILSTAMVSVSLDLTALYTIIPYGLAAVLSFFLADARGETEGVPTLLGSFRNLFAVKHLLLFVISIALIGEVAHSVTVFLNQPQYLRSGIKAEYFGPLMALIQVVGIVSVKAYKISSRLGKIRTIGLLLAVIAAGCFLLAAFHFPVLSIFLIALVNAGIAVILPISLDIKNESIKNGDRATMLSMYAMVGNIISAVVNLFIGRSADISTGTAFSVCGFISAVSVLALVFFSLFNRKKVESL